jgi:HNH endonuclease
MKKDVLKQVEYLLENYENIKSEIEELKNLERDFMTLTPTEKALAVSSGIEFISVKRNFEEMEFIVKWLNGQEEVKSEYQVPCRNHVINAEFCSALNIHMSSCPMINEKTCAECPMYDPGITKESHEEERFSQWWLYNFPEVVSEINSYIQKGEMPNPKLLKIALIARTSYKSGDYLKYFKEVKKKFKQPSKRQAMSPRLRFNILKRDNFTCVYCGRKAKDDVTLHVDHIHPVSKGGTDTEDNLVTACEDCNLGKSDTEGVRL